MAATAAHSDNQRLECWAKTSVQINLWDIVNHWKFGQRNFCHDECLILRDVQVGQNCWIRPFTILDGADAVLKKGDDSSIGGEYTHTLTTPSPKRLLEGKDSFRTQNNRESMLHPSTRYRCHSYAIGWGYIGSEL